jgi:hypothetical protein
VSVLLALEERYNIAWGVNPRSDKDINLDCHPHPHSGFKSAMRVGMTLKKKIFCTYL